jgi:hypothetical protein
MANGNSAADPETGTPVQKQKAWRAKEACTFDGKLVKEGEIVLADKMDNPHFEKASEKAE